VASLNVWCNYTVTSLSINLFNLPHWEGEMFKNVCSNVTKIMHDCENSQCSEYYRELLQSYFNYVK